MECYCNTKERFFQPPERILMEFDEDQLRLIFLETPSPIERENFLSSIMEVYGYSASLAQVALEFMENRAMIKNVNGHIYPIKLTKYQEVPHILLGYPEGLGWKRINKLIDKSYTKNKSINPEKHIGPDGSMSGNPDTWIMERGVYGNIKHFRYNNEDAKTILLKVCDIIKLKNEWHLGLKDQSVFLISDILKNVQKEIKAQTDGIESDITFYELRYLLSRRGREFGIFFLWKITGAVI